MVMILGLSLYHSHCKRTEKAKGGMISNYNLLYKLLIVLQLYIKDFEANSSLVLVLYSVLWNELG